jgi:hypothetical protein
MSWSWLDSAGDWLVPAGLVAGGLLLALILSRFGIGS